MDSPSLPMDMRDVNVCLLSAKKKRSTSSPSLRELDQMSLCDFPSSSSVSDLSLAAGDSHIAHGFRSSGRKRVRQDYDTMSVVDLSFREPQSKKSRRPLTRVANLIQNSPIRQAKRTLKRSLSFSKEPAPPSASKYRVPGTPKKRPSSTLRKSRVAKPCLPMNWVDAVSPEVESRFSKAEIKRHEAIYSIYRTESELVEDLRMVINIFFHPMLRLNLVTEEDHCLIFGNIQTILALHEDLLQKLNELRIAEGEDVNEIGSIFFEWSKTLEPYTAYCANLVVAKHSLETKRQDPAFEDFLQRCLQSEFSRKIDLWTFLDSPRSRIMKYPILMKEVKKKTPSEHSDQHLLDKAISSFDTVLKGIDSSTGIAKCLYVISRLDYLHDEQHCAEIMESKFILCSGILKTKSGSKLHAFLFDKVFVLTRPTTRSSTLNYQVYRQPIPVSKLQVEDIDGEARLAGGSFRGTLRSSTGPGPKHLFKISCSDLQVSRHSHTLQANGDYDKKAWIDVFKTVVPVIFTPSTVTTV